MNIRFTKMHGLGNDFMVVDATQQSVAFTPEQIALLARRDTGVGFDQCLILEESHQPDIDFFYRIYNADGSEVGQCGNGARCLARFVQHYGLSDKKSIKVSTKTTQMTLHINEDNTVTVDLGRPQWEKKRQHLTIENHTYEFYQIDVGNPHAILLSEEIDTAPVKTVGRQLSIHPFFPNQCNIGFMQILQPNHIRYRVYERGCGETQACGSGAVAAAAIGSLYHGLTNTVTVSLAGGDLIVHWPDHAQSIFLTGSATFVYEGILM